MPVVACAGFGLISCIVQFPSQGCHSQPEEMVSLDEPIQPWSSFADVLDEVEDGTWQLQSVDSNGLVAVGVQASIVAVGEPVHRTNELTPSNPTASCPDADVLYVDVQIALVADHEPGSDPVLKAEEVPATMFFNYTSRELYFVPRGTVFIQGLSADWFPHQDGCDAADASPTIQVAPDPFALGEGWPSVDFIMGWDAADIACDSLRDFRLEWSLDR